MADEFLGGTPPGKKNPFGDDEPPGRQPGDEAAAIEHAAARIRRLKSQVGAEGLTLSATRELLDHVSAALDAAARAIRDTPRT
jgi:hypothetical protein